MKKLFTLSLIALLFSGLVNAQSEESQLDVIYNNLGSITIDGDTSDAIWESLDWINQELQREVTAPTTDMTSKFKICHDGNYVYLIVCVKDETPNNDAEVITDSYKRDNIEFFFGWDTIPLAEKKYEPSDWQIRIQRDADNEAGTGVDGHGETDAMITDLLLAANDFEFVIEDDGSTYIMEVQFPKSVLSDGADDTQSNGKTILFEIQTADNTDGTNKTGDGGRTQQMFWYDATDDQWEDPKLLAKITLKEEVVSVPGLEFSDKSIRYFNNMLNVENLKGNLNIYNLSGSIVRSVIVENDVTIDISDLNTGIYIVKCDDAIVKIAK